MRRVVLALLLVAAACGDDGSSAPPRVVATSTTTAEEARDRRPGDALSGPSSTSGQLSTLLQGVLQLEGNCLYLVETGIQQRFPILWPADTRWDAANQSVVSSAGEVMPIGGSVEGRGGFFFLSDVNLLAGTAARNRAAECVENGQIAVVENTDTAIAPNP